MRFRDFIFGWMAARGVDAAARSKGREIQKYIDQGEYAPAGVPNRLFSLLVDSLILGVVGSFFSEEVHWKWISVYDRLDPIFGTIGWFIFLYFGLMYLFKGQSLGKMITKTVVISNNGEKLKWWQALLRTPVLFFLLVTPITISEALKLEAIGIVWFLLYVFFILFNKRRRGIHDIIVRTRVVYKTW